MESKMTQFAGDFCTLCVHKLGLPGGWLLFAGVCAGLLVVRACGGRGLRVLLQ